MDPCPHDEVQGPTNDKCFKNGTLVYQLKDPRTKAQFAKCYDAAKGFNESSGLPLEWTMLDRIKTWQNEGVGELNHVPTPAQTVCPKGYCPWTVPDPANKSNHLTQPCSTAQPLGGCGAWGNMTVGYGVGSSEHNIGPEYGFSFAMDEVGQLRKRSCSFVLSLLIPKNRWFAKTCLGQTKGRKLDNKGVSFHILSDARRRSRRTSSSSNGRTAAQQSAATGAHPARPSTTRLKPPAWSVRSTSKWSTAPMRS
jgi:hypothetical protein